jgi:hypothetical protein
MLGGRKAAAAASAKPSAAPGSCSAQGTATPAVPAAGLKVAEPTAAAKATAAADEAADDEVPLKPDDEVTVEPEELEVFEKVAAMEREKEQKQQQQASQQVSSETGLPAVCLRVVCCVGAFTAASSHLQPLPCHTYSSHMSLLVLSHHSLLEVRPWKDMPCDGSCLT